MRLEQKLEEWQRAGLLDATTAERLRAHEQRVARPVVVYAIGTLGAVTIGIGIISVVAANWDGIGYRTKLVVDLLIAAALALGVFVSEARRSALLREVLVVVYYAFTLASLALLGQVYHLGTPEWVALCTWSVLTVPLLLLARTRFPAVAWVFGLGLTFVVAAGAWIDALDGLPPSEDLAVTLGGVGPALLLAVGRVPWLLAHRRQTARVFYLAGWACVLAAGALLPMLLYESNDYTGPRQSWGPLVCVGLLLVPAASFHLSQPKPAKLARAGVVALLACIAVSLVAGLCVRHAELNLLGALLQLGFLGAVGFTAAQLGWLRSFQLVTALIALRLLVVYFEVFGSMLSTGLGMITGGGLTLLLAWVWKRKSPQLAEQLRRAEEA
jgi:uncharacterized membrane protein